MLLPVSVEALGLKAGASRFTYDVLTFSSGGAGVIDEVDDLTYDPAKPGIDFTSANPVYPALPHITDPIFP